MDVQKRPVAGVQIGVSGEGGSGLTARDGKARVRLARDTKANTWVSLQILASPHGSDFEMVSPWNYRAIVPSFENESENFVDLVVVQRGDRAALESGLVLAAVTKKINEAVTRGTASGTAEANPKESLAKVAEMYGLSPDDVDLAIRNWGAKSTEAYDVGLAALYERNYPRASEKLSESLEHREKELALDQKAVADAAFFLGLSLMKEGKYPEAVKAYRRYFQLRPDDTYAMAYLGQNLMYSGDYSDAEDMFRQARAIDEKVSGSDSLLLANDLSNLAALLLMEDKDHSGADALFEQSLAIREKSQEPGAVGGIAITLNNLAGIVNERGDHASAERLWEQALAIGGKIAPNSWEVVMMLAGLASIRVDRRDFAGAEALYRRAMEIGDQPASPQHVAYVKLMNDYGLLQDAEGNYALAEKYFGRALRGAEKLFPDNPYTERIRSRLESARSHRSQKLPN